MAEQYSITEYTALIWPEHYRSQWSLFEGKNWGTVDALKAEKKDDKLRLFAKITANQYLIDANKDGQKLFTSIEPDPDYRSAGRCYLMGLAVTDSPASSGTTRLKFSMGNKEYEHEYSQLEPFIFEPDGHEDSEANSFFKMAKDFFTGKSLAIETALKKDTEVTEEQLKAALSESLKPFSVRLDDFEKKFSAMPPQKSDEDAQEPKEPPKEPSNTFTSEQLSTAMSKALDPMIEKMNGLETKFSTLLKEVPGQRPLGEGASTSEIEAF